MRAETAGQKQADDSPVPDLPEDIPAAAGGEPLPDGFSERPAGSHHARSREPQLLREKHSGK